MGVITGINSTYSLPICKFFIALLSQPNTKICFQEHLFRAFLTFKSFRRISLIYVLTALLIEWTGLKKFVLKFPRSYNDFSWIVDVNSLSIILTSFRNEFTSYQQNELQTEGELSRKYKFSWERRELPLSLRNTGVIWKLRKSWWFVGRMKRG